MNDVRYIIRDYMLELGQVLAANRDILMLKSDDGIYLDCSKFAKSNGHAVIIEGTPVLVVAPNVNAKDYVGVFSDGMFCLVHQMHLML